ncbi:GNAT family N-acetyltransferase [Dyadobacter crusticola]|uniref:GNAT family N-acetyltransferase n=1 Tax=Dyadobacter crusticola TaxID=292407 RepID=UPI0004E135F1|nr:GNAT family protein [Dyadobacter crusticola]
MEKEIELRLFQRSMASDLARLADNPKVSAHVRDNFPYPYTIADAHYWIDMCSNVNSNAFQRAVFVEGEFAGGIGVVRQEDIYRNNAEIGYWLGEPFWGRNIMTAALREMTAWIFENTSITRLFAGVFESNAASMRVLEKAGYELEAVHRKAIIKNGQVLDEHLYVKLA